MFCPHCRVEYRPGFSRCSDCEAELVDKLPPADVRDSETDVNSRPDLAPSRSFLAWFLPMCTYVLCAFALVFRPRLFENPYFALAFVSLHMVSMIGSFWMLYQAVRYEKRVARYAFLAFIPFLFVWYSLVRVPLRTGFDDNSDFIR